MNQNDYVALGLSALVVGGLAVFGRKLGGQQPPQQPCPFGMSRAPDGTCPGPPPFGPPVFPPGPTPPPAPGSDPQYEAARRAIESLVAALQAQGGGTPAQREQAAQVLDTQAATLEASGQSPAAVGLLRQASQQLRSGQLPVVPPGPNPAPVPAPFPFPPFPNPFGPPASSAPRPPGTAGTAATGQTAPSADLTARYTELRDHCADYLQGARPIDPATLGAADRTSTDLHRAGDAYRAADLGALATASYARVGIARPVPVTA